MPPKDSCAHLAAKERGRYFAAPCPLSLTALALAMLVVARCPDLRAGGAIPAILEEFDVPSDGDFLLVPIVLKGKTYLFIVDTGSFVTAYDTSLRPQLGPVRAPGLIRDGARRFTADFFDAPYARLGQLELHNRKEGAGAVATCIDLSALRHATGEDVRGVLGRSFLLSYVVRLDFDRGKILFLRECEPNIGTGIPIEFVKGHTFVRAGVRGIGDIMLEIDTGLVGPSGTLHPAYTEVLKANNLFKEIGRVTFLAAGGTRESRNFSLPELGLSSFRHDNLTFQENSGKSPSSIGLRYLSRYIVTFDFPQGMMYLKPSKRFLIRDRSDASGPEMYGISISRDKQLAVTVDVVRGSIADGANIESGDRLLAVDGLDVRHSRLFAIRELFRGRSKKFQVTTQRGNEVSDCWLTPTRVSEGE